MITLYSKPATTAYCVVLPWCDAWGIKTLRPTSERVSLAGSVIRQAATVAVSTGTAQYSEMVPSIKAAVVRLINAGGATCYLTDSQGVYEVEIDANISPTIEAGRQLVTAAFKVVRRIHTL